MIDEGLLGEDDAQVARLLRSPEDESFLREAYQVVLGRGIDANGYMFYAERLVAKANRIDVLWEVASSAEGNAHLSTKPALASAIARAAGRKVAASVSVTNLLALPDATFVDACIRALMARGTTEADRSIWLNRLRGGTPRYRILKELAASSGRSAFPDIAGLDALIAQTEEDLFPTARSTAELLAFQDEAFVDCAYKSLLRRAPDFSGASYYVARLQAGYSRSSVLVGLARSGEGRMRRAEVAGLRSFCWRYRLANVPLLADLLAPLLRAESDSESARTKRMLGSLSRRLSALEALVATTETTHGGRQPASSEAALLARHETLLDIQRDSFEREMGALRKMVSTLARNVGALSADHTRQIARGKPRRFP